jgi:hypothetical protein
MNLIDKLAEEGLNFAAKTGVGNKIIGTLIGVTAEQLENTVTALNQPSLCFIPIQSDSLSMRRSVDIGTTMLISQTDQRKDYLTDNAAPRPRTWTGTGYISSLSPILENGILIKPTVQAQQAILEAAADSRQAVKFKTDSGEVVDVLVQDLQISSTPQGPGVRRIQYTVQEVKVLNNSVLAGTLSEALGNTAAKSVPIRAITNLGRNTALGAGVAVAASALLNIDKVIPEANVESNPEWTESAVNKAQATESIDNGQYSKEYDIKVRKEWESIEVAKRVTDTGLIPVEQGQPVGSVMDNIVGKPVLYKYTTFRLSEFTGAEIDFDPNAPRKDGEEHDKRGVTLKQVIGTEEITLLCTLTFDVDPSSSTYEHWNCKLDYITKDDNEPDIADRSFTVYPNTIHFDGDSVYIVSITSELENIGFNDLASAFISIGVPVYE